MKLTHGLIHDLFEKSKKRDAIIQFEGLRITKEMETLHIVSQLYPTQKLMRLVNMIHIHIQLINDEKGEITLLYHDGGKEDTEIEPLADYPEWTEAIIQLIQVIKSEENGYENDKPADFKRE